MAGVCVDGGACYETIAEAVAASAPGGVISLADGTYVDAVRIPHDLTIQADTGATVYIWDRLDGAPVFAVEPLAQLILEDLTVQALRGRVFEVEPGGSLIARRVEAISSAVRDRGAIGFVKGAKITLEDAHLVGGTARYGGQVYVEDGTFAGARADGTRWEGGRADFGGALALVDTDGTRSAHTVGGSFADTTASERGGGIYVFGDDLVVKADFVDAGVGSGTALGGAIYSERGDLDVQGPALVRGGTGPAIVAMAAGYGGAGPVDHVVSIEAVRFYRVAGVPLVVNYAAVVTIADVVFVGNAGVLSLVNPHTAEIVRGWAACNDAAVQHAVNVSVLPGQRARLANFRFVRNAVPRAVIDASGGGALEVSHVEFVGNGAPALIAAGLYSPPPVVSLTDSLFVGADHALAEVQHPDASRLVGGGNVLWDLGAAAPPELAALGAVADAGLYGWDPSALCGEEFDPGDVDAAPFATWFGAGRDAGVDGPDRDGSPADAGAAGGPDAWDFLWGDDDEDGFPDLYDCPPATMDGVANPGVDDAPYDGFDVNCDRWSDFDVDRDGFDAEPWGDDCDDARGDVHPGLPELGGNAVDEDCDGVVDGDGDGFVFPDDCDDANAAIHPGLVEDPAPVDLNCDGRGDVEAPLGGRGCATSPGRAWDLARGFGGFLALGIGLLNVRRRSDVKNATFKNRNG